MTCFMCKGNMEKTTTNHVVNLSNSIIIIKHVPCSKCTQCGEAFYDDAVVDRLESIVKLLSNEVLTEVAIVDYSNKVA